jgi:hypothetical protein
MGEGYRGVEMRFVMHVFPLFAYAIAQGLYSPARLVVRKVVLPLLGDAAETRPEGREQ